jgi:hypothetical protein
LLENIIGGFAVAIVVELIRITWNHRPFIGLAFWALLHPKTPIRVSVSALCAFKLGEKFVLVGQSRRPNQVGPIGGAIDIFPDGLISLEKLGFTAENQMEKRWGIKRTPLRGSIDARKLLAFRKWLRGDLGRESFRECVEREMHEELNEEILGDFDIPKFRHFRMIRNKSEGPTYVRGLGIWQWRYIRVFEYILDDEADRRFVAELESAAISGRGIELVTVQEIREGRSASGKIIGNHTEYLLDGKAKRTEVPWQRITS